MGVSANARVVESTCDPLTFTEPVYKVCELVPLNALVLIEPINSQMAKSEPPQKRGSGRCWEVW